jgi:serine/threonine-protein kinase
MIGNVPRLAPGDEIAGYKIEEVAGEGGMGVVYRALDLALGRPVALKLIVTSLASDADFRARFKRESQLAASLDHPNVVPVYEAGEHDGVLYLAMRFVDGTDLGRLAANAGGLPPERAVAIVAQLASALDAAHERGLVHRDIKPANVLVTGTAGEEHAYLTDFGLTKHTGAGSALTRTGVFVGTLDYVAPEQIRGEPTDGRADVYALGCVLYTALTVKLPFDRDSDVAKMHAHLNDAPPRVTEAVAGAPAGLDAVIDRALAKDPEQRFQTAGELARAARAALARGVADAPAARTSRSREERLRRTLGIALPAVLLAGIAAASLAAAGVLGSGEGGETDAAAPAAVAATAAASATATATPTAPVVASNPVVQDTLAVGRGPDGVAASNGRVFVANRDDGTLTQIDTRAGKVLGDAVPVGRAPDGVVSGKGVVWATTAGGDELARLQVNGDRVVPAAKVPVGDSPEGVSLGRQLVWVGNRSDGTVNRVDRASATLVGPPIGVGRSPTGIFVGKFVWVTNNADDTVTRIDPSTAQVVGEPIQVGSEPRGVTEGFDAAWVVNSGDGTVTRLDRLTGEPVGDPIKVGRNPREVAVGLGFVWVTNKDDNTVSRIDPETGRVIGSAIPVGTRPIGIAISAGSVWVANHGDDTVTRIGG